MNSSKDYTINVQQFIETLQFEIAKAFKLTWKMHSTKKKEIVGN